MRLGTFVCAVATALVSVATPEMSRAATNCGSPGANQAIIWEHHDYSGNCDVLEIGSYPSSAIVSMSVGNDNVSSVSVGSNVKITLYEHDLPGSSQIGDWLPVIATRTLHPDFHDKASSIRVESRTNCPAPGTVQAVVWADINFSGYCDVLDWNYPVTDQKILGLSVGNDSVSSVATAEGFEIVLWQHAGLSGSSFSVGEFDSDASVSALTTFNDLTSSMKVFLIIP
jgi:hypothetical protein